MRVNVKFLEERRQDLKGSADGKRSYWEGYKAGLSSEIPDSSVTPCKKSYYAGYVHGSIEREEEPPITIHDWMTPEMVNSIKALYFRDPNGSPNRAHFFNRVHMYHDYCGLSWCGMFIGIEKDGYTHS